MRTLRPLMTLALAAATMTSCVSRNVETISAEDAAAMSPPPAPLTSEDRAAAVADTPGFTVIASVSDEVSTIPEGILYVIVRVAGREGGPPLAVKRLPADLPVEFSVTAADVMVAGTPLVDAMDVTVRLDQDGDAWSNQEGDLAGTAGSVAVGDTVEIVLRPADPASAQ